MGRTVDSKCHHCFLGTTHNHLVAPMVNPCVLLGVLCSCRRGGSLGCARDQRRANRRYGVHLWCSNNGSTGAPCGGLNPMSALSSGLLSGEGAEREMLVHAIVQDLFKNQVL